MLLLVSQQVKHNRSKKVMNKNVNLGKKGTDVITGFEGIVTGFAQYVTGCDQYLLSPKTDDPCKKPECHWFDSNRVVFTAKAVITLDTESEQGADVEAPKK